MPMIQQNQAPDLVTLPANKADRQFTLLLDVTINTVRLSNIIRAEKLADGRVALPVSAWNEARLHISGEKLTLPGGIEGYLLDAIPQIDYTLDINKLTLMISAPAHAFETGVYHDPIYEVKPVNDATPGFYVNYDFTASQSTETSLQYGAFLEGVLFNQHGSWVNRGFIRGDDHNPTSFIRTDTYWQTDLPSSMETLVLGDTLSSNSAWSRPIRFAGIRWSRNFSLRPGYFSFPLPSISGSAALPSTVDLLINNQRQQSTSVLPGPFSLVDVPTLTGGNEIQLVIRDLLGNETRITQHYYTSPRLLTKGLSDFAFESGFLRENYGTQSNDYSSVFAALSWNQGLSQTLSGGARLELQAQRQASGIELTGLISHFAIAWAAAAYSLTENEQGGRYVFGLEHRSLKGSGTLQVEYFDSDFVQLGASANEMRPRERLTLGVGQPVCFGATASLSLISQSQWQGDSFKLAMANLGFSLSGSIYVNMYANKQFNQEKGWSGGVNFIHPLGKQRTLSAGQIRNHNGDNINSLQFRQSAPQGPGIGFHLRASDEPHQQFQSGATYNTNYGQVNADTNIGQHSQAIRLGASGSIGRLPGLAFATRRIGLGSFAVVKVGDLNDVPIYRSNQITATTNHQGLALIANLLPYQINYLTLDPSDLPFDVEIKGIKKHITPYARSGILIEFPIRRSRNALLVLSQPNGTPVPSGARVRANGLTFIVAKRGEVYLMDLTPNTKITVHWPQGHCHLSLVLPIESQPEPRIGPLICGDSY